LGGSAVPPLGIPVPELMYSLDVNALNFCPFSALGVSYNYNTGRDDELLVAVPNLVESCWVCDSRSNPARGPAIVDAENWKADVWTLPTCQRLHAAIGKARPGLEEVNEEITTESAAEANKPTGPTLPRRTETGMLSQLDVHPVLTQVFIGIIMSLHLHRTPHPSTSTATELRVLMAFEAGNVECWAFRPTHGKPHSIEGIGWDQLWNVRFHAESGSPLSLFRTPNPTITKTKTRGN